MKPQTRTIPEGLDLLLSEPDKIIIRKNWRTWKLAAMALFAAVWDIFLVFWYSNALSAPTIPWIMIVFPLGHVAVGVGITYYVIAGLFNKTEVIILAAGVRVTHHPVPWPGNKSVNAEEITDILVRERDWNRGTTHFHVMYADRSRKEQKLVTGILESDQAEFIAATIQDILGEGLTRADQQG